MGMPKGSSWERLERGFVLDGVATSWAKLPPYNPQMDPAVASFFGNKGMPDILRKTRQSRGGTSQLGWLHDHQYNATVGATYIRSPTPKMAFYRDKSHWQQEDPNVLEMVLKP